VGDGFGHRVEPRRSEGTATKESPGGQPAAATGTVLLDGVDGVLGAGREEATRRGTALGTPLVPADRPQHQRGSAGRPDRDGVVVAAVAVAGAMVVRVFTDFESNAVSSLRS
jgi:hypothetical protein